jgi:hypothetical protein
MDKRKLLAFALATIGLYFAVQRFVKTGREAGVIG